jgi:GNAT superfamily N-acetyltransferase
VAPTQVTRTYLEMTSLSELRPAAVPRPEPRIERMEDCPVSFFRYLYQEVGRAFQWTDRLAWNDATVRGHLATPGVSIWLMSWGAAPAGYFELREHEDRSVEIAYFGLLPDFIGRGWGKHLLTRAVQVAWHTGTHRVWLHTCTLDHPAALPNYLKRGFQPVREEVYEIGEPSGLAPSGHRLPRRPRRDSPPERFEPGGEMA